MRMLGAGRFCWFLQGSQGQLEAAGQLELVVCRPGWRIGNAAASRTKSTGHVPCHGMEIMSRRRRSALCRNPEMKRKTPVVAASHPTPVSRRMLMDGVLFSWK